ncbi:MAG: hypothetical protein ACKOX6_10975 [Bdellovibrio sp.]
MERKIKTPFIFFAVGLAVGVVANCMFLYFNNVYSYLLAHPAYYPVWVFPFTFLGVVPRGEEPSVWYYIFSPVLNGIYYSLVLSFISVLIRIIVKAIKKSKS